MWAPLPEGRRWLVRRTVVADLVDHARAASPHECCGILIGGPGEIAEAWRAPNLAESSTRFLVDPQTHVTARRESRRRGLAVVGFYHSHPRSAAVPSPTDIAEASYDDHCHVIVSLAAEPPDVRLYEIRNGDFHETTFEIVG